MGNSQKGGETRLERNGDLEKKVAQVTANPVLDAETKLYESKTKRSKELFDSSKLTTPYGVHSNYRLVDPYPLYGSRGRGSRIWDADDNEYIDFNMGFGALLAGHSHPILVEAISERLRNGTLLGLEFEDSERLARVIMQRFHVDMVRFSSTGMEATMHALRFARAFTKKNKIIKFEGCYHGSQDHLLVSVKPKIERSGDPRHPTPVPSSKGTPLDTLRNTLVAPFNDIAAVESIVKENEDDFAGIILEPIPMNMGFVMPDDGFLEGLRGLCDDHNAVLIFDEVKACGKYYGGASDRFGVRPDLKVLGKAIAGGFSLSAVCGNREIMEEIVPGVVAHAGTFNSNPVGITAGLVCLTKILTSDAFTRIGRLNSSLASSYRDIVRDQGLEATVVADGVSGVLSFARNPIRNWRDFQKSNVGRWSLYYLMMLNRGIIPAGTGPDEQWTISIQHSEEDIRKHAETFEKIAPYLRDFNMEMPIIEAI